MAVFFLFRGSCMGAGVSYKFESEIMENITLADGIVQEQSRCRELLSAYKELGRAGMFGHTLIEDALKRTDKAVMEGNTVAMISLYEELKAFE